MEESILISYLNDFIFCPVSIYFHKLYGNLEKKLYQDEVQINGTIAHEKIDTQSYSTSKHILQNFAVYSSKYNIMGKIDTFNIQKGTLTERKNRIINIYDGYIFQLYAQYYSLVEMGYVVKNIRLYSMTDNKNYEVKLPYEDALMNEKFEKLVEDINNFNMDKFHQINIEKCKNCIYESICDRSIANVNKT